MSCLHEHPDHPGALIPPRRNNYYFGKLMDVAHFQLEQIYGNGMRRMLNRLSLGEGVLCGLSVEKGSDAQICVSAGVALDSFGREIVLSRKACIDPWTLTDECGQPAGTLKKDGRHLVHLCIAHRECGADFAPMLIEDCNLKQECAPGTIVESSRLLVRDELPQARSDSAICDALLAAGAADEVIATVETGGKPVAVAVSHDSRRALVVNETGPALHVIDLETGAIMPLETATLTAPLGGVSIAPDGGPAFITHAKGVAMVDLESNSPTVSGEIRSPKPYGVCVAAAGGKALYAIDSNAKKVDCIDVLASAFGLSISATINTRGAPADLAVSPDGKWLYVLDPKKKELFRVECATNAIVTGAAKPIADKSRTLAVRGAAGKSEAFVARDGAVQRIAEDGTTTDFTIAADPRDSAFTTSGGRYYVVNRAGTAHELVVFATTGMNQIARVDIGDEPTSVAVARDSQRAVVTNAGSGTISIIDMAPRKRLCEELSVLCTQPVHCPCVTLATIELLADGTIGVIDSCSHRRIVYSNSMLLEFILCLAQRLNDCCGGVAVVPLPQPPEPETPFRIETIEFHNANGLAGPLADLQSTSFRRNISVSAIRVTFNRDVELGSVTAAPSAGAMKKASFLVRRTGGRSGFVPGRIVADGSKAVRLVISEPNAFPIGDYKVALFGDADVATGRPAITEKTAHTRLDGEPGASPKGLPSGDGNQGGAFEFKFRITD